MLGFCWLWEESSWILFCNSATKMEIIIVIKNKIIITGHLIKCKCLHKIAPNKQYQHEEVMCPVTASWLCEVVSSIVSNDWGGRGSEVTVAGLVAFTFFFRGGLFEATTPYGVLNGVWRTFLTPVCFAFEVFLVFSCSSREATALKKSL